MTRPTTDRYDPITAEVIGMAMNAITDEMGITIERTSGQPVATDAKDYSCVVCKADGGCIAYYGNNLQQLGGSLTGTQALIAAFDPETVKPGDAFIYNDPYTTGALHQCDVAVQAPVFSDGRLVAWIFANIHQADIGGMTPAGFCPESRDVYGEGLRMGPTKFISEGTVNESVIGMIQSNVRTPIVLGDIRSQLAAINVGRERLLSVIAEHGVEQWEGYLEVNEHLLSRLLGDRIAALPVGRYRATDWVEYDAFGGELYVPIECELEVTDDARLVFDFAGSGAQVPGYSNASRGAMLGSVMPVVLAALLPDFDVNAGVFDRVDVEVGDAGTITNPMLPAGMSGGHVDTGSRVLRASHGALTQAMERSEDPWVTSRSYALGGITIGIPVVSGRRASGAWEYSFVLDQQALGHGALSTGDGVAFGGVDYSIAGREPDVEMMEATGPIMYLWRREITDSGGAGAYRGGNGLEAAYVPWKVDRAELAHSSGGGVVPTRGSRGGYPGGTTWLEVYRDALPEHVERLPGPGGFDGAPETVRAKCGSLDLGLRDAVRQVLTAGSGWGDPLLRPASALEADIARGSVTPGAVAEAYGVVFGADGRIDVEATERRRDEVRRERLDGRTPRALRDPGRRGAVTIERGRTVCGFCATELDDGDRSTGSRTPGSVDRRFALADRLTAWSIPVQRSEARRFELVERCCPGCATLLEVEIEQVPPADATGATDRALQG